MAGENRRPLEMAEPAVRELDQRTVTDQAVTSIHTSDRNHEQALLT